jgi:AraC-like DNA-binding protein
MDTFDVGKNELLFSLPHQFQQWPSAAHGNDYYKLGFDEECLSRLPKQYPFLLNPLNQQKICFSAAAAIRLKAIFKIILDLLSTFDTDPELILAHLNSLLTEINTAYFAADKKLSNDRLTKFIGFKVFVENNLTDQPTIREIAEQLAISTDSLYQIVKHYSGLSPKEFLTNRLILEARRRIHYGERSSVKELAFELGFNDPDYFSRLFKKVTGKTIAAFFQDLS